MAIVLDNPQTIANPAVKLDIAAYHMTATDLRLKVNWIDSGGLVVKSVSITLIGQDFLDIVNEKVTAGQIDKKIAQILKRTMMQKVKTMLSVTGTVDD